MKVKLTERTAKEILHVLQNADVQAFEEPEVEPVAQPRTLKVLISQLENSLNVPMHKRWKYGS